MGFTAPTWIAGASAAFARLAAGERLAWTVLGLGAAVLALAWRYGRTRYRTRVQKALCAEGAQIADTRRIPQGMPVMVEAFGTSSVRKLRATVQRTSRRLIELRMADTGIDGLSPGTPVSITLAGAASALRFQGSILDRSAEGKPGAIFVARPPWFARVQRRKFHRVPVGIRTTVTLAGTAGDSARPYRGLIQDLSAGGIRVATSIRLPWGSEITVRIPIGDSEGIPFSARVLASDLDPTRRADPFVAQCEFVHISNDAREMLVRYCFDHERQSLRRANGLTVR